MECSRCGCRDGNHAQECTAYYNDGYGKRKNKNTTKDEITKCLLSEIKSVPEILLELGISMYNQKGEARSFWDVFTEISEKWNSLEESYDTTTNR